MVLQPTFIFLVVGNIWDLSSSSEASLSLEFVSSCAKVGKLLFEKQLKCKMKSVYSND